MTATAENAGFVGVGIYSTAQASRLTGIPAQNIRRWTRGYHYTYAGRRQEQPPVVETQLPEVEHEFAIGFLDLMEVRFIDAFRHHGVSLPAIRQAAERAREVLDSSHPFSRYSFKTDGKTIFAEIAERSNDPVLLDLVHSQYAFREVLAPYLYRGIDFESETPIRWWPMPSKKKVVLDPQRQFGQPIVAREGVRTEVLAAAFRAEESIERVARWFDVDKDSVCAAVEFENFLDEKRAA